MNITVPLQHPYEVVVGPGARHGLAEDVTSLVPRAQTAVILTTPVLRAQPWFDFALPLTTHVIEVPEGESAKNLTTVADVCEQLAMLGLSRHDVIIGVGGGATTDLAGFVAAIYLRGIAVVHVATSVAAQVDAAIGGKTGVDLTAGKNLVGAFHHPRAVYCDSETLATLSDRERVAGLGEVAKCCLLEGCSLEAVRAMSFDELVTLSIALKARIVGEDEFERTGQRALLNYGHTLGHAVETLTLARDTDALRHGEAVAIGLRFAARLAVALGLEDDSLVAATDAMVANFGLTGRLPVPLDVDDVLDVMARDKKAHHDLTFVLDTREGFQTVSGVSPTVVAATYASFIEESL
jgi:5-deoxy-5-amino-3-dehydroquinate synthase